jgi:hypothetical protein
MASLGIKDVILDLAIAIGSGSVSVFFFSLKGRPDVVPVMFEELVLRLNGNLPLGGGPDSEFEDSLGPMVVAAACC